MTQVQIIRQKESQMLTHYVQSLPQGDRRFYINDVIFEACSSRRQFYNWQYGLACIPSQVKKIMERVAGVRIFERPPQHTPDPLNPPA